MRMMPKQVEINIRQRSESLSKRTTMLKLPQSLIDKLPIATANIPLEFLNLGKESYQTDQKSFYNIASHPSLATHVNNFERHRIAGLVIHSMYGNKYVIFSSGATLYNEDA